ncbi:MAG TPA: hypothetical protein PLQ42_09445 [Candidatus Hydrogenedentes bacterium]|nr:MAG: hypothetical protein BWY07_02366 [Candidatus Hydrogenedentes bacterium ADurb.Bin170]HOD96293.1 hypothetical protein [Candidatus Hydrogenedentota bacterium]HOR51292.1 hypothetical protein [Candidatus Hydrogenedentota bacterium]HPK25721.1 hypothetical protein [Candidatus Hydrogenedentota bacterium]
MNFTSSLHGLECFEVFYSAPDSLVLFVGHGDFRQGSHTRFNPLHFRFFIGKPLLGHGLIPATCGSLLDNAQGITPTGPVNGRHRFNAPVFDNSRMGDSSGLPPCLLYSPVCEDFSAFRDRPPPLGFEDTSHYFPFLSSCFTRVSPKYSANTSRLSECRALPLMKKLMLILSTPVSMDSRRWEIPLSRIAFLRRSVTVSFFMMI